MLIYRCRRSLVAIAGIGACMAITKWTGADTSGAVSMIVAVIAGANASQAVFTSRGMGSVQLTNNTENK